MGIDTVCVIVETIVDELSLQLRNGQDNRIGRMNRIDRRNAFRTALRCPAEFPAASMYVSLSRLMLFSECQARKPDVRLALVLV